MILVLLFTADDQEEEEDIPEELDEKQEENEDELTPNQVIAAEFANKSVRFVVANAIITRNMIHLVHLP